MDIKTARHVHYCNMQLSSCANWSVL